MRAVPLVTEDGSGLQISRPVHDAEAHSIALWTWRSPMEYENLATMSDDATIVLHDWFGTQRTQSSAIEPIQQMHAVANFEIRGIAMHNKIRQQNSFLEFIELFRRAGTGPLFDPVDVAMSMTCHPKIVSSSGGGKDSPARVREKEREREREQLKWWYLMMPRTRK